MRPAGVNGGDANVSTSLQSPGQLLQLGSLRANRNNPSSISSSSLCQRRTSGPSQGATGSGPSYNSAFASSKAQRTTLDAAPLDGEDPSEVFDGLSKVEQERASRAVRALKAQSRGWVW